MPGVSVDEQIKASPLVGELIEGEAYRVLRFWNNDVLGNTDWVVQMIAESLREPGGAAQ